MEPLRQELERDLTTQARITRSVHFSHAADAKQSDDFEGAETRARLDLHRWGIGIGWDTNTKTLDFVSLCLGVSVARGCEDC